MTWVADKRVLCCGDLFIWASPNAGNPQKVQRYPKEWAAALRRMIALEAEYLLPGHGLPIIGADRVTQALTDTADLLDSLVDQTLAIMNDGGRLDDAIFGVVPPAQLMDRPYLKPVYDEPEFIVRNVWRLYGGWWDGNPASLSPRLSGRWRPNWRRWPGERRRWPTGRRRWLGLGSARPTCGWPGIWPSWPGWPRPMILGSRGFGAWSIWLGCRHRPRRWPGECSAGRPGSRQAIQPEQCFLNK